MSNKEKQEAYNCDVLYSTNNEIGFDYLRDNMVVRKEDRVQRPLNYCIVDEVDSILIDEARTPLIISGGKFDSKNLYKEADRAVKKLTKEDYDVDVKTKNVSLTEEGTKKLEKEFHLDNLYDISNSVLVHHINQALKANYGFKLDVDYVVEDGAIIIVDPFTGRLMHGRQYSEGLHQAIEAKEGVTINEETRTMATITFQNLFRMYNKLSGMTGTAKTEEEEFIHIYNMYVIQIPTNKPVAREDLTDLLYSTEKGKFDAIIRVIKEVHKSGQPILVGTISVEKNELLSSLLKKEKLPHEVLNAKNHAREAEIISHAGEKGAITIATNMAGRGTDIKLGEGVKELGGLYVIGTERHESRRIDNQLRGRSGRQGDPGTSQFFVSFDDDLMRRFGTDKVKNALISVGLPEDEAIRSKMFIRSVESAQKKVEGNNYDTRKSLLDYDKVMNQQRQIVYKRRNDLIDSENVHEMVYQIFENTVADLIDGHIAPEGYLTEHDIEDILEVVNNNFLRFSKITEEDLDKKDPNQVIDLILDKVKADYEKKLDGIPEVVVNEFEKAISLRVIDSAWVEHISTMEQLKEGIGLRGYAQSNPLTAYTEEGFDIFDKMQEDVDRTITTFLLRTVINQTVQRKQTIGEGNQIKENEGKQEPVKSKKIGRNELCYCGSGKKYKQCHGKK